MQKRQFRIGELAEHLGVERFVVRFWEKEFDLKPCRSEGGQRFYEEKDLETLHLIKDLLYNQGFTISGAKKILKDPPSVTAVIASKITTFEEENVTLEQLPSQDLIRQLKALRKQLVKLQQLL